MKKLSPRLMMCAGMVSPGSHVTDVGCDHAGLSIFLVENGICPGACCSEVSEGPLSNARRSIEEAGLSDRIETVLSDGLKEVEPVGNGTLVLAGMGARLMLKILSDSPEKVPLFSEYVFQPQSEDELMRRSLRAMGLFIEAEADLYEGDKYYHVMRCTGRDPGSSGDIEELPLRIQDRYGPRLLAGRGDAVRKHISSELERYRKALSESRGIRDNGETGRTDELAGYVSDCEAAFGFVNR
ncbi:MAG: SAM-dependent methyltransferase [Lachnospiraceae bacterium]|nr:SAM-dependent methyltransferase [Lachnospiraceae bacterium]